ncbi:MAG: hypothetical protein Q9M89_09275 [Persephonella sp.]|nr:hypothetical protein [Persephonella sp.]
MEKDESIYQKTLSEISEIERKINKLIGNEMEYKTLKWVEKEIKFINEGLKQKLKSLKKEQIELSIRIYELLENLIGVYKDLKKYVDKELKII